MSLQNIIFTDVLPEGTTFISGTLTNDSGTQQIEIQLRDSNWKYKSRSTANITINVCNKHSKYKSNF